MLNAEIQLNLGDTVSTGVVKQRVLGADGRAIGTYDEDPRLNTMVYEVEFPDGQVRDYSANVLAENMLRQVDSEGFTVTMVDGIVDHQRDPAVAVPKSDGFVTTKRGTRRRRITTQAWKLLVRWKDSSETWATLKTLKESNPLEVAEYAKAKGIDDEPAFAWWVPYILRKRDVILSAVKSCARKVSHNACRRRRLQTFENKCD